MKPLTILLMGLVASAAFTAIWHGPLDTGEQFAQRIERQARLRLDRDEMYLVQARMQRSPLSRRLVLSGPADDFQRGELVRRLDGIPGVLDVRWDPVSLPQEQRARP